MTTSSNPSGSDFRQSPSSYVKLSAGRLEYMQIGQAGPAVVFVHGALVDGSIWRETAARLAATHRCFLPTWPLGSHREAMKEQADLTPRGVARLVLELLEALDLEEVTLVGNDSGGAICQCVMALDEEVELGEAPATWRIARVVLTNTDAFEVFPPKAFRYLTWVPKIPGMTTVLLKELHTLPFLGRLPTAFGRLTRGRLDTATLAAWFRPAAQDRAVRRDLKKLLGAVSPEVTLAAARSFSRWERPVLLVWGDADPFFRVALAERLQRAFRSARLERIAGGRTFVMLDEPDEVAAAIRRFVAEGAAPRRSRAAS